MVAPVKSLSQRRNEAQESLLKRTQENYDNRDSSGKFAGYLNPDIPIKAWNANENEHLIDVLPYITGDRNPNPRLRGGAIDYVLILFVHFGVGPADSAVVCPLRNYNQRCPLCEEQKMLKDQGYEWDSPEVKALEPKKRTMYNIICYDTPKDEEKGVMVWEVAFWNFERHIVELAQKPRGGGAIPFSDPNIGKSIKFKRTGKKATDTTYLGHAFVDREYEISNEDLDATLCLEDLVVLHDYDKIYEIWKGTAPPAEQPAARRERPVAGSGGGAGEERPTGEQRGAGPTTGRRERPAQAPAQAPAQEEQAGGRRRRFQEENAAPDKGGTGDVPAGVENKCPAKGGVFGQDFDKLDKCNTCDLWDNCSVEAERLEQLEKEQRAAGRFNRGNRGK